MNHEFCIACGKKSYFEISKPKFCPSCGSPFNVSSASVKRPTRLEEDDEPERESNVSFDIKKLRASIVSETASSKKSLDDLWRDPAPRDPNFYRPPSSDPSGNEIIRQTMSECSPVKAAVEIGVAGDSNE